MAEPPEGKRVISAAQKRGYSRSNSRVICIDVGLLLVVQERGVDELALEGDEGQRLEGEELDACLRKYLTP